MRLFYTTLLAAFIFLTEESIFSWVNIRSIKVGGIGLLAVLWLALILTLIIVYLSLFLPRRKELLEARRILRSGGQKDQETLIVYFDHISGHRDKWKKRHSYYYKELMKIFRFLLPFNASVIEVGCGTGDVLGQLDQPKSAGIDFSRGMIEKARKKYPKIQFEVMDIEDAFPSADQGSYDYILMSDLIGHLNDVQKGFEQSRSFMHDHSRLIVSYYSYLWEPVLRLLEKLYLKMPQFRQNWLSQTDIKNLLELAGFEVVKKGTGFLLPANIPILSWVFNKFIVRFPLFRHLGLIQYLVARPNPRCDSSEEYSLSVIIPARNEYGNIEKAVLRTPQLGKYTELLFVEGNSTDQTWEEIQRVYEKYHKTHKIKIMQQPGKGKGDAVRKGFAEATGDIVTILDCDLTVLPEELPKFYQVIASGLADFANGCRLIYPMEKRAMRFFNALGNKFFSLAFTWLLDQPIKDTLCGTKMLLRKDYENIAANRSYFGDFDFFGDYDLLFGASKLNMKIMDVPIRYQARTYGSTNIPRWRGGLLLMRMMLFAMRKIKFY